MENIPASVGILTYNSAETLERALDSVKDFNDIIICDGSSSDATLEIAARYGARVILQDPAFKDADNALKDYSGVRNQCLAAARYDWFLYIDSDESISRGLHEDIARIARRPLAAGDPLVYRIPQVMSMDGTTIRWSSNYPGYQTRFFNKKSDAHFGKPVHEKIYFDTAIPVGTLVHPWHTYRTRDEWVHYFSRLRKYRDREMRMAEGESFAHYVQWTVLGTLRIVTGTTLKAAWVYLRHGFRETIPVRGELGRVASPLALLGRLTAVQFGFREKTLPESGSTKKLYYIANNKIPTDRAYGVQIVEMCAAFAAAGAEVTLVLPRTGRSANLFAAYGVERTFAVQYLPVLDLPLWLPGAFVLRTLSFARAARAYLARKEGDAVVYTRGEMALFLASIPERFKLVWETHIRPEAPRRYARAATRAAALIAVTKHYAEEIPSLWNVPKEKVLYAPDGVRPDSFKHLPSKEEARTKLHLPQDKKIALYAGSDLPWKGLRILREASELLPQEVLTVFVGNIEESDAPGARRLFAGARPYTEIPLWLAAADVLVLTGDPASQTARYYTSPLKLFEYMASGRPIVATDLPAVRDILSEREAYLALPTAPALAAGIMEALSTPEEALVRAQRAREAVDRYSWETRARAILAHIHAR